MVLFNTSTGENIAGGSSIVGVEKCQLYLLVHGETKLSNGFRGFLYFMALAYCFIGLSAITARFFKSMENVVKHTRTTEEIDPCTNTMVVRHKKVWNYTIADITLLAFGTSFPQISLATIDALRNLGKLYAGGRTNKRISKGKKGGKKKAGVFLFGLVANIKRDSVDADTSSYHCNVVRHIALDSIDSSVAVGFYCRDKCDFDDFCVRATKLIDQSNGAPLFTIAETRSSPRPGSNRSALIDNATDTQDCDLDHGLDESENSGQEDEWQLL